MAKQIVNRTQINDNYSTSEFNTGKKYPDGRPIYRKTIQGQVNLINGSSPINHGISGLTSTWELLSMTGGIKIGAGTSGGSDMHSLYYRETGGNWCHFNAVNTSQISVIASFAWGSSYYSVTLEYVK